MLIIKVSKFAKQYIEAAGDLPFLQVTVGDAKVNKRITQGRVGVETYKPDENYYRCSMQFWGYEGDKDNGYLFLETQKSIDPPGAADKAREILRDLLHHEPYPDAPTIWAKAN